MLLTEYEYVVTAYAESVAGPGWANTPLWIVIRNRLDNTVRVEAMQPDDQPHEVRVLYGISLQCHRQLTRVAEEWLGERTKGRRKSSPTRQLRVRETAKPRSTKKKARRTRQRT